MMEFFKHCNSVERVAVLVLVLLAAVVLLSPWLAPWDPDAIDMSIRLQGFSAAHPLGTDSLGRDELSRLMYGGVTSIFIAIFATLFSYLVIGLPVGIAAGLRGGLLDECVTMITSIFQGIPSTAFLIVIVSVLGPGLSSLVAGVASTTWPEFSRIVRADVMLLKKRAFIQASLGFGIRPTRLVLRHILPNLKERIIVLITIRVAQTLLTIAALSFLGLGVQPPMSDWGVMVNEARTYLHRAPFLFYLPTAMIFAAVWSINTVGTALNHYWNRARDTIEV